MQQFKKSQELQPAPAAPSKVQRLLSFDPNFVKYEKYSTEELKKLLDELPSKLDKEIEAIKAKYAKQKKDLESVLAKKKKKWGSMFQSHVNFLFSPYVLYYIPCMKQCIWLCIFFTFFVFLGGLAGLEWALHDPFEKLCWANVLIAIHRRLFGATRVA